MPVERRGWVTNVGSGQLVSASTGIGRNLIINGRRQPSHGGTSRMMREYHVRICEGLGVQLPGSTRQQLLLQRRVLALQASAISVSSAERSAGTALQVQPASLLL